MKKPGSIVLSSHIVALVCLCFLLVGHGAAQASKPIRSLPLPEARIGPGGVAEGDMWMRFSPERKLGFVQGLLEGSREGYIRGCLQAQVDTRRFEPDCLDHIPMAQLQSQEYVGLITDFYSKYSEDRALPIRILLLKLLEPKMNVDGVHKWLDDLIEYVQQHR